MPERFAGKTFYTREEAEALGMKVPRALTAEELAARRAKWAEWEATTPPPPEGTPDYRTSKNYRDDLVGTEFAGWTQDPATGEWRDKHGRPAYDATGQRIRYEYEEEESGDHGAQ
ncbi:hypothetical protein [Nocardia sp. NPDC051570]|uniref:hypothetical protein n=1 Tax=Nocardia sp. NPDC051570 TaxID=3364324 RepID=UPI0037BAB49F